MNIKGWDRFCQAGFPMQVWAGRARDDRKRPQIAPQTVWKMVTEMVVLGQKSLLEVDQWSRERPVRARHGSKRRMVVSDSTMECSLSGFDREGLRANLGDVYRVLSSRGEL